MEIQAAIMVYIREQGLLKAFVAERAGIGLSRFSQILNCRTVMRLDEFLAICKALNVKPSEFIKRLEKINAEVKTE